MPSDDPRVEWWWEHPQVDRMLGDFLGRLPGPRPMRLAVLTFLESRRGVVALIHYLLLPQSGEMPKPFNPYRHDPAYDNNDMQVLTEALAGRMSPRVTSEGVAIRASIGGRNARERDLSDRVVVAMRSEHIMSTLLLRWSPSTQRLISML
jgi:hypothetical protein